MNDIRHKLPDIEKVDDKPNKPDHIAIIMDGNARWAKKHCLPKIAGYQKGAEVFENIAQYCAKIGIKYLTVYAFSSENWQREKDEISEILQLFNQYLLKYASNIMRHDISISFIGDRSKFSTKIQKLMEEIELKSRNKPSHVIIALSYGGRNEIVYAAKKIADWCMKGNNEISDNINQITWQLFDVFIRAKNPAPDPDLLIRTSGEKRLSNFLLWQTVYTELYFTDVLWPDFTSHDLDKAIDDFGSRHRSFGATR